MGIMYPCRSLILKHLVCLEIKINTFDIKLYSKSYMPVEEKGEIKTKKISLWIYTLLQTITNILETELYHPKTCSFLELINNL